MKKCEKRIALGGSVAAVARRGASRRSEYRRAHSKPLPREAGSESVLFSPRDTPVGNALTTPSFTVTLRPGRARCTPLITIRSLRREAFADHAEPVDQPPGAHDFLADDALRVRRRRRPDASGR